MMQKALVFISVILFFSCTGRKVVTEQELKQYVFNPENGMIKTIDKNGVRLEASYRPSELMIARQLDAQFSAEKKSVTIDNFLRLSYFILRLSKGGREVESYFAGGPEYLEVEQYLSGGIAKDLRLITDNDTLEPEDILYSKMYGSADATAIMAVFKTDVFKASGDVTLVYDDTKFDLGHNEFVFDYAQLKKLPTLKF
jgi:hypothetical protein